jgi:hypothetical protein
MDPANITAGLTNLDRPLAMSAIAAHAASSRPARQAAQTTNAVLHFFASCPIQG